MNPLGPVLMVVLGFDFILVCSSWVNIARGTRCLRRSAEEKNIPEDDDCIYGFAGLMGLHIFPDVYGAG